MIETVNATFMQLFLHYVKVLSVFNVYVFTLCIIYLYKHKSTSVREIHFVGAIFCNVFGLRLILVICLDFAFINHC